MTRKEKREVGFRLRLSFFAADPRRFLTEIAAKSALKSGDNLRGIPKYKARSHKTPRRTRLYFTELLTKGVPQPYLSVLKAPIRSGWAAVPMQKHCPELPLDEGKVSEFQQLGNHRRLVDASKVVQLWLCISE